MAKRAHNGDAASRTEAFYGPAFNDEKCDADATKQKKLRREKPRVEQAATAQPTEDERCTHCIRALCLDIVQKGGGHPGTPLGMAPVAHLMWGEVMSYSPQQPRWMNRDRFVMSNGHGCALNYAMLHLAGYKDCTMEQLQTFHMLGSRCVGHPERDFLDAVETTTGPLGQGIANGVGLAMAEKHLAARFNRPGFAVFDHKTWVFMGDGCPQEGVAHEAMSLAGHLGLGKLNVIMDANFITQDGSTDLSFTDNMQQSAEALGWHSVRVQDGNTDYAAMRRAIAEAAAVTDRPSLIVVCTTIGYGAMDSCQKAQQDTWQIHGTPLGPDGVRAWKQRYGRDPDRSFFVDADVYAAYKRHSDKGDAAAAQWAALVERYAAAHPADAALLRRVLAGKDGNGGPLPDGWEAALPAPPREGRVPTRQSLDRALAAVQPVLGNTFGGSADVTASVFPKSCNIGSFAQSDGAGSYIRWGIREHGMVAAANGIQAYGGLRAYVATFTNFYGYAMGAVRLTAIMRLPVLMVSTHDSVFVGEDGVTHQPVEMIPQLRSMPGLRCIRPADAEEVNGAVQCWLRCADAPTIIFLTRQAVRQLPTTSAVEVARGAYYVRRAERPGVVIVATGSEVELSLDAADILAAEHGVAAAVVSMPSCELFDAQPEEYRRSILPDGVPVVSVEAAATQGWERYAHYCIGIDRFGTSAPGDVVKDHFGFVPGRIAQRVAPVARHFEQHGPAPLKVPPAALDYRAHNAVADPLGAH